MKRFFKHLQTLIILTFVLSCNNNDDSPSSNNFSDYLKTKQSQPEEVIACAASSKDEKSIFVYFFPETNTSNYRLYLLPTATHQKDEFDFYQLQPEISTIKVANTIRGFELSSSQEEVWAIVSFEKDNEIHYSNPINLKHKTSPTIYNNQILVDTATLAFSWTNTLGADNTENAIYFEILMEDNSDLISGTYTYENRYTYLDNSNVVLNITQNNTQQLSLNTNYGFAVMGVSEDNWVNFIAEKNFKTNNF
ncbi:hypothetical protein [Wenyingzhuangia sp. IMCC45574]